jgi:hypothetical protein
MVKKNWTEDEDVVLLRQVSADTPFMAKHGKVMEAWNALAVIISSVKALGKRSEKEKEDRVTPQKKGRLDSILSSLNDATQREMDIRERELEFRRLEFEERRQEREEAKLEREEDRKERMGLVEIEREKTMAYWTL